MAGMNTNTLTCTRSAHLSSFIGCGKDRKRYLTWGPGISLIPAIYTYSYMLSFNLHILTVTHTLQHTAHKYKLRPNRSRAPQPLYTTRQRNLKQLLMSVNQLAEAWGLGACHFCDTLAVLEEDEGGQSAYFLSCKRFYSRGREGSKIAWLDRQKWWVRFTMKKVLYVRSASTEPCQTTRNTLLCAETLRGLY